MYLAAAGEGISGGTRIHTELTKQWLKNDSFKSITILASDDGYRACVRAGVPKKNLVLISTWWTKKINYWLDYIARILNGVLFAFRFLLKKNEEYVVYAASDFWADFFPPLIIKLRYRKQVTFTPSFYLRAPSPWESDNPYKGVSTVKGFFYWLSQQPVYLLIKRFADFVFVTSEPDVGRFITHFRNRSRIVVVQGGVDINPSETYFKSKQVVPSEKRKYDACFVGRFHHQKGVLELVDIWRLVCKKRKSARLAMVGLGTGSMGEGVQKKVKSYKLDKNIDLFPFMDGVAKCTIFKNSKIVLHPATYDSGGMAPAEAMAWGLPGVSFDLESLKTYYPKGMLKTKQGNLQQFAHNILDLLTDKTLYKEKSHEAHKLIVDVWDWQKRADQIFRQLDQNI